MPDVRRFTHLACGSIHARRADGADEAIAQLAGSQHGVVGRGQLIELGLSERAIDHRLRTGRLRRLFAGVYAVGHEALTASSRALAGVLSAGPGSAASHWTAAALHGLWDRESRVVHVSHPRERRARSGLLIHRAILPAVDVTARSGVPTTSVARLLLDLSPSAGERRLRTMAKRAEFNGLIEAADLVAVLRRHPRRRGRRTLVRMVGGHAFAAGLTQSPLEDDFIEFCGRRGIPMPETNASMRLGARQVRFDCVWRESRLVVELDSRAAHERALAFEDDRARDRAAIAAGWRPMRVTSAQIRTTPDDVEHDIRAVLTINRGRFAHPQGR